jgi:hypothetical protein
MNQTSLSDQLVTQKQASSRDVDLHSAASDHLIESYAEDLMNDLFGDVDRILEGDMSAYTDMSTAQFANTGAQASPAKSLNMPLMVASMANSGTTTTTAAVALPPMLTTLPQMYTVDTTAGGAVTAVESKSAVEASKNSRNWLRWVGIAAGVSGALAVGIWWVLKQPNFQPEASAAMPPSSNPVSEDTAFLQYLQRSLNVIDAETIAQGDGQRGPVAAVPLPTAPVPSQTVATTNRGPNIIERVFVPVYQPVQSAFNLPPLPTTHSTQSLPTVAVRPSIPALPGAATPSVPAPNQTSASPTTTATIPNIAPSNTHALVGILNLGDRSAAIFDINGVSQRVYVGEAIGSSGWILGSVANQEVIVRRNGETRSIYIGQQF